MFIVNKHQSSSTLLYDVNQCPPVRQMIPLSIQHVFAMFGATILVPILVNQLAGAEVLSIPVAISASGIGTLIYQFCTKWQSPVYLGSSFAFIAPIAAAYATAGNAGAFTGLAVVGAIYALCAILVKLIGTKWIDRLLPPVIIGPMIMIIGLGLAPSAISQIGMTGDGSDWKNLVVAAITLLTAIIIMIFAKGFLGVIPFLMAIVVGYLSALALGMVDLTPVSEAAFFSVPNFQVVGIHYTPNFAAIWQVAPIALVTMAEHIGDHKALSVIVGRDLLKEPGLKRTLMGDGLATFVAALIGAPANTTYGENTAVVGMTKVASVRVITLAAVLAFFMGFLGKFAALISTIPNAVLGGVSVLLYGFIALNGAKEWVRNRVNFDVKRNIAITAVMLVFGLGGAVLSIAVGDITISFSGMSLAAIFGILLNLLPHDKDELAQQRQNEADEELLAYVKSSHLLEAIKADAETEKAVHRAIRMYAAATADEE